MMAMEQQGTANQEVIFAGLDLGKGERDGTPTGDDVVAMRANVLELKGHLAGLDEPTRKAAWANVAAIATLMRTIDARENKTWENRTSVLRTEMVRG